MNYSKISAIESYWSHYLIQNWQHLNHVKGVIYKWQFRRYIWSEIWVGDYVIYGWLLLQGNTLKCMFYSGKGLAGEEEWVQVSEKWPEWIRTLPRGAMYWKIHPLTPKRQGWIKVRLPVLFRTDSFRTQTDLQTVSEIFTFDRQFWTKQMQKIMMAW